MLLPAFQTGYGLGTIALWMAGVIAAALVLALGLILLKRWMSQGDQPGDTVWTLHELTTLRDCGELTIPQYERLKSELIEELDARDAASRDSPVMASRPPNTSRVAEYGGPVGPVGR